MGCESLRRSASLPAVAESEVGAASSSASRGARDFFGAGPAFRTRGRGERGEQQHGSAEECAAGSRKRGEALPSRMRSFRDVSKQRMLLGVPRGHRTSHRPLRHPPPAVGSRSGEGRGDDIGVTHAHVDPRLPDPTEKQASSIFGSLNTHTRNRSHFGSKAQSIFGKRWHTLAAGQRRRSHRRRQRL